MTPSTIETSPPTESRTTRFPLHITLGTIFVTALVAFGVAVIAYSYFQGRRIELLGAHDLMDRIGRQLQADIAGLYQPAQGLVDITSKSAIWAGDTLDERLAALPPVAEALKLNTSLSSFYVGTEDGDFFLIRTLDQHRAAGETLEAPPGSAFAIQSIEREQPSTPQETLLFFDDQLRLLERRPLANTNFDPREREWYRQGMASEAQISTDFYIFFTTGEVGLTFARRLVDGGGVVGADITLEDLENGLAKERITPSTRIALTDRSGRVIALSESGLTEILPTGPTSGSIAMPRLGDLDDAALRALADRLPDTDESSRFELEVDGESWLTSVSSLPSRSGETVLLSTLIPRRELLADVDRIRNRSLLISGVILALAIGLVLWISRNVSKSLRSLATEAANIRRFKLGRSFTARSRITEVAELAETMGVMKDSLQQFFEISRALSAEKDQRRLLEMILREACKVAHADGGAILMENDEGELEVAILEIDRVGIHFGGTSGVEPPFAPVPVTTETDVAGRTTLDSETAGGTSTIRINDLSNELRFDLRRIHERFEHPDYEARSLMSVPLADQKGALVGLMQLVNARDVSGAIGVFDPEVVPFVEALSSDAAVALDLRRLLKAQKDLLEAFIHVVAGAIDAKSPYTHGHCQRMPVIAKSLAQNAHGSSEPPFADFHLSEDEWYELHIASWLHDCGKVTTPEYVVDKSTKLETLYDRIHEIRTRFEVLWRDAEIDYLEGRAAATPEDPEARRRLEKRWQEIHSDWAFIAECNQGEIFMTDERIEQVHRIATQTWERHLDDRLGLSHEEFERKRREAKPDLPATESLLADKAEHLIERPGDGPVFGDNPHGFDMDVPEHLYNMGEIYNLCIQRGTLTTEERFKINDHIIQTINMLKRLPFPRELKRVTDWAGNHHEKLDGTGYPRRMGEEALSIPERIMAIADIFEALTATDRPYMRPKTMSTALRIMGSMRDNGHLCPDLFELFLESGVWRDYGEEYLQPEQMDEVDLESLRQVVS